MKRIEIFSSFFCRGVVLPFAVLAVSLICIACERDNTREIRPPVTEAVIRYVGRDTPPAS